MGIWKGRGSGRGGGGEGRRWVWGERDTGLVLRGKGDAVIQKGG